MLNEVEAETLEIIEDEDFAAAMEDEEASGTCSGCADGSCDNYGMAK